MIIKTVEKLKREEWATHAVAYFFPFSLSTRTSLPVSMDELDKLDEATELIKVLAHPTRIRVLRLLGKQQSLTVSAIQRKLQLEQSLLSHHLTTLSARGVLQKRRKGRKIYCSLADPSLLRVLALLLS